MIEDTKTLYKAPFSCLLRKRGNAAIAEAANLLQSRKLPETVRITWVSAAAVGREGGERPTTLMSMEKWKTS
jgi:hypothetical protein